MPARPFASSTADGEVFRLAHGQPTALQVKNQLCSAWWLLFLIEVFGYNFFLF
jgi:hypothetical protein